MQGNRCYSLKDRRKLIAFQNYLETSYPLFSYDVADIGDYVKVHFVQPIRPKEKVRLWKSTRGVK